jgi:hypothetical protein
MKNYCFSHLLGKITTSCEKSPFEPFLSCGKPLLKHDAARLFYGLLHYKFNLFWFEAKAIFSNDEKKP